MQELPAVRCERLRNPIHSLVHDRNDCFVLRSGNLNGLSVATPGVGVSEILSIQSQVRAQHLDTIVAGKSRNVSAWMATGTTKI